ncbi:hypothetical protein E1B28_009039 [Marasmius oreades]|uniref:Uncharacterized protein n=1 Tax=Marasmius oreades TaxID=181124 RepID=A0A9P7RZK4_9AGAR|nr:uncharacterized protein E1B28_009039 [Marasmius oreades]KAG7092709.1 hypothetical protein E1B28_009039 [Marasmius oreades]
MQTPQTVILLHRLTLEQAKGYSLPLPCFLTLRHNLLLDVPDCILLDQNILPRFDSLGSIKYARFLVVDQEAPGKYISIYVLWTRRLISSRQGQGQENKNLQALTSTFSRWYLSSSKLSL